MAAHVSGRATWVWDRPEVDELVDWSQRHGVAELFVAVGAGTDPASDPWLREVVRAAHSASITVAALGGDQAWIDKPRDALGWLARVLAADLFDGVHVDVEFWARDDWGPRRSEVVVGYLALLEALAASPLPLPLEADLGASLDDVRTPSGERLYLAVMRIVGAATVLTYRNTVSGPDSISSLGAAPLRAAVSAGIRCRLAVETQWLGDDPVSRKQTFHHLGRQALETALGKVDELQAGVPSYAGIAVHHYRSWRALRAAGA